MHLSTRLQFQEAEKHIERVLERSLSDLFIFPKYIIIETVNTCNARCIMCPIDFSKPAELMSDNLFDKIVAEISKNKDHVEKIMLYLDGEPLLDNKLPEKIRKLKSAGIKTVNISTNASLLDDKKGLKLLEAGIDEVFISIDSLNKDVFEEIRVGLDFNIVYKNTIDFIRLRDQVNSNSIIRILTVVQEKNHTEVFDWAKHWEPFLSKNDQITANQAHNWGSQTDVMQYDADPDPNDTPCQSLWGSFVIHQDGVVNLCCIDTHRTITIGNVKFQDISEIWQNSKELNRAREQHLAGQREKIGICDGCTTWKEYNKLVHNVIGEKG